MREDIGMRSPETEEMLDLISRALLWCFGLSVVVLLFWFVMVGFVGDWVYRVHSRFIPIDRDEFAFLHYQGMMCFKMAAFGLFFLPWLGLRLARR